ncbi:hypothetical protein [Paracoccus mutanolyticus]|uniref:hypothetical protein n=1 Tax=Paracoccus mutanolyticus TaxID=1499308 RepID=UPI0016798DF0|nr:hypothetical protein [Paracoccus mutanolyticus]
MLVGDVLVLAKDLVNGITVQIAVKQLALKATAGNTIKLTSVCMTWFWPTAVGPNPSRIAALLGLAGFDAAVGAWRRSARRVAHDGALAQAAGALVADEIRAPDLGEGGLGHLHQRARVHDGQRQGARCGFVVGIPVIARRCCRTGPPRDSANLFP